MQTAKLALSNTKNWLKFNPWKEMEELNVGFSDDSGQREVSRILDL